MTAILKLPLLLAVAQGIRTGFTPPQPLPSSDERNTYDGSSPEVVRNVGTWGPKSLKILAYASQAWEAYLILLQSAPSASQAPLVAFLRRLTRPDTLLAAQRLHASPAFVLGAALICAGAYLRVVCFRRLGRYFTFELSVQKNHELVTDGPYAVVRHPSYGAALMQVVGFILCLAAPGSWWRESRMWHSRAGKLATLLFAVQMTLCIGGGIDRTFKEDAVMKNMFQEKWVAWAKQTKYRLIPFVF